MWSRTWVSRAWACFLASPVAPPAKAVACARRPAGVTVATSGEIPRRPDADLKARLAGSPGPLGILGQLPSWPLLGPRTSFYNLYFAVLVPEEASAGEAKDARLPEPLLGHPVQDLGHLALPDHGVPRAGDPEHQLVRARDDFVERRNREVEQVPRSGAVFAVRCRSPYTMNTGTVPPRMPSSGTVAEFQPHQKELRTRITPCGCPDCAGPH